jgi:hypothetical protein
MPPRTPARFTWDKGYWPNTSLVTGVPGVLVSGQNLWNRGSGLMVSSKGFAASVLNSGGSVNPLLNVGSTYGGLTGGGNIVQVIGTGIFIFAGSGTAYVGGVSKGSVAGGTITIWTGAAAVQAGLAPPGAPTIAVDLASAQTAFNKGLYSIALTAIRSLTGGESSLGEPSNAVTTKHRTIQITALGSMPSGADKIGIYATKRGFGEIGPFFHLYDVATPSLPYNIVIPGQSRAGWTDGQLGDLSPLDFNVPPACGFCFAINSVVVAAGCYGGAGLSPSYPNKPESYPPRFVVFIPGGGTITAVKGSGIEGAVLVCTANSINLVTASQSDISPLNVRPIWPTTGVVSANQLCMAGGEIYSWVGERGPVRDSIGGEGDPGDEATTFAQPVMKAFAANGYTASNVIVVFDPASDTVWYVKGLVAIGYCRYLGQWHPVHTLPTTIVTAVTDTANGRALLSDALGNLYQFETGTGTSWSAVSQLQAGEFASFMKTLVGARAMVSVNSRLDIYADLNIITPASGGSNLAANVNHGSFHHLNIRSVKSFGVGLSGTDAGGTELYGVELEYIPHPVRL